jgi:arylformamidase
MSDIYGSPEYFQKYPAIPNNVANYLIEKAIKIVGIDSCSVDHKEFNAHKLFLQNEILIIENLTNLSMLSGKDFNIIAFPLNVSLDGSPIRVVAQLA